MAGDVAGDEGGARAGCFEWRNLLVHRTDQHAFVVAEHGRVAGAGDVIVGILERRAHVDDFVEIMQFVQADEQVFHKNRLRVSIPDFRTRPRVGRKGRGGRDG
ncbi:hypothetical protein D3C85_1096420 [compost metagenome]